MSLRRPARHAAALVSAVFVTAALISALAACVPGRAHDGVTTSTVVSVRTIERPTARPTVRPSPSGPTFTPRPATSVTPLPPGAAPAPGEVEKPCPYIASSPEQNPATNVADIDGSHVYRTTVLPGLQPVGCRFYFYAPSFYALADIEPYTFATHRAAYDAMVLTGRAGREVRGRPALVPGVDAVVYRTTFYGPDGDTDWACAFTAGRTLVIVHTQRHDTSLNAVLLARAVAGRF